MNVSPEMSTRSRRGFLAVSVARISASAGVVDVGLADEPHDGAGTAFAVFHADGHRQFSHTGNHVTSG